MYLSLRQNRTNTIFLLNAGSMKLLDDWIALQLLAMSAGAAALTGAIALVTYARPANEKDLCHGGIVAGSWLLSGEYFSRTVTKSVIRYMCSSKTLINLGIHLKLSVFAV